MSERIPFNKPYIAGKELYYVAKSVALGNISGDGHFTQQCSRFLERRFGIGRVLMTTSWTGALEMALALCGLKPGDEVILPSYTFVSAGNSVVLAGGRPVFVDIRPDTLNLDENQIAAAITSRTRAIVPLHYAGVACEMDTICDLAQKHGLIVVEDGEHAMNGAYREKSLGSIGDVAAFSFHETKNFTCGEGGALCINREDLVERAEILRDKGTNRKKFFRGEVDKYTWVDVGSSYVPSEIVCAFLLAQLELMSQIAQRRREIYEAYIADLCDLEQKERLRLPSIPPHCQINYQMIYVLLSDAGQRDRLLRFLNQRQILATFHYVPLHISPYGRQFLRPEQTLPVTENVSDRVVRLPFFGELSERDRTRVVEGVHDFFGQESNT